MKNLLLVVVLLLPSSVSAQTFTVYGADGPAKTPLHSHTWIVVTSADKEETICISWGPLSSQVRLISRAEIGKNYSHEETIKYAKQFGCTVSKFGPFPCSEKFLQRAKQQKRWLESGKCLYKVVNVAPDHHVCNCYQAVAQLGRGVFVGGLDYGSVVSRRVAEFLQRNMP